MIRNVTLGKQLLGTLYLWECMQTILITFLGVFESTKVLNKPTAISNTFPVYSAQLLTQPKEDAF